VPRVATPPPALVTQSSSEILTQSATWPASTPSELRKHFECRFGAVLKWGTSSHDEGMPPDIPFFDLPASCDGCGCLGRDPICVRDPDTSSPRPSILNVLRDAVREDASSEPRLVILVRAEARQAKRRCASDSLLPSEQPSGLAQELLGQSQPALTAPSTSSATTDTRKEQHRALPGQPADALLEP
jgi:hypothetical protein